MSMLDWYDDILLALLETKSDSNSRNGHDECHRNNDSKKNTAAMLEQAAVGILDAEQILLTTTTKSTRHNLNCEAATAGDGASSVARWEARQMSCNQSQSRAIISVNKMTCLEAMKDSHLRKLTKLAIEKSRQLKQRGGGGSAAGGLSRLIDVDETIAASRSTPAQLLATLPRLALTGGAMGDAQSAYSLGYSRGLQKRRSHSQEQELRQTQQQQNEWLQQSLKHTTSLLDKQQPKRSDMSSSDQQEQSRPPPPPPPRKQQQQQQFDQELGSAGKASSPPGRVHHPQEEERQRFNRHHGHQQQENSYNRAQRQSAQGRNAEQAPLSNGYEPNDNRSRGVNGNNGFGNNDRRYSNGWDSREEGRHGGGYGSGGDGGGGSGGGGRSGFGPGNGGGMFGSGRMENENGRPSTGQGMFVTAGQRLREEKRVGENDGHTDHDDSYNGYNGNDRHNGNDRYNGSNGYYGGNGYMEHCGSNGYNGFSNGKIIGGGGGGGGGSGGALRPSNVSGLLATKKRKFIPPQRLDANGNGNGNDYNGRQQQGGQKEHRGNRDTSSSSSSAPSSSNLPPELAHCDEATVEQIRKEIIHNGDPVTFEDIAGLADTKRSVEELVCWPIARPDLFTGLRTLPKGLLLFGPPGNGKTLFAKAIAHQSGATFFSISASSLMSKWIGEGEKLVRALFAVAAYEQPSIIFIDEVDSMLCMRSSDENEATRRLKTEFLVQLDGAGTHATDRVLVVGATNRPSELDEAARRRFVRRLFIPLPDDSGRRGVIERLLQKNPHDLDDEAMAVLVNLTEGFSCADVKALCTEAAMGPMRELTNITTVRASDVPPIQKRHFDRALLSMRPSVSEQEVQHYILWNKEFGTGGQH